MLFSDFRLVNSNLMLKYLHIPSATERAFQEKKRSKFRLRNYVPTEWRVF